MQENERRRAVAEMANSLPIKPHDGRQKYPRGSRVQVDDIMPACMSHFDSGFEAIVEYTYAQKFWGDDFSQYSLIKLNKNGVPVNGIAWYHESQLNLLSDDLETGIMVIDQYQSGARK